MVGIDNSDSCAHGLGIVYGDPICSCSNLGHIILSRRYLDIFGLTTLEAGAPGIRPACLVQPNNIELNPTTSLGLEANGRQYSLKTVTIFVQLNLSITPENDNLALIPKIGHAVSKASLTNSL